jgi:UDP-glucose 4-epimerase
MKTYLVTGGAGFIGSHFVDALCERGDRVVVVDNLSHGRKQNINKMAIFYKIDIRSPKLESVFKKYQPDIVFHCAAQISVRSSVEDPLYDLDVNVMGSVRVLELCKKYAVKKIIATSTGGAMYDESCMPANQDMIESPISPYGINKWCMDRYLQYYNDVFGLKYVSLRFANVYGPRQDSRGESGAIAIFIDTFMRGDSPTRNGSGEQTRDYIYIQDVVSVALKAARSTKSGVYTIGTGVEVSLNQVIETIRSVGGFSQSINVALAKSGEVMRSFLDSKKAQVDFSWAPKYDLKKGIQETYSWFRGL